MAENMQDVKRRIKSVTSMEHITNAMKLVSAAKMRRAKATFDRTNEQFRLITESIQKVFSKAKSVPEKYAESDEIKKTCYIVMTSNKGLCAGFNTNIIKEAETLIEKADSKAVILAVGSKGRDYFQKRGFDIISEYAKAPETITFQETQDLVAPLLRSYEEGDIDEIVLVYTTFVNTMQQDVKSKRMLPFDMDLQNDSEQEEDMEDEIEYEPSVEAVFNYLVKKYFEMMFFGAVIESATCEHAARRMAMENATDNAREMLGDLELFYNRARQAAITNQLIEIVSGSEALK